MKIFNVVIAAAFIMLFFCDHALALKQQVNLTPADVKDQGFAVATKNRDDGTIDVTVTRDLSKAAFFDAASDLELVREGTLEISGAAGPIVRCNIEPRHADGTVIYRFQLGAEQLAHSIFTVSEIDDYKKSELREHLLGGGTFFRLRLEDFAKP